MRILLVAALLVVAAIGGCNGGGWSDSECQQARLTLQGESGFGGLKEQCRMGKPGACEAVAQLQADINDNCR